MEKTNVMRLLDASGITYNAYEYDPTQTDGEMVAKLVNKPCDQVFKTLVTVGSDNEHYVFVVPVNASVDLKKGANKELILNYYPGTNVILTGTMKDTQWIESIFRKYKNGFRLGGYYINLDGDILEKKHG